jgi:hypothetical protein
VATWCRALQVAELKAKLAAGAGRPSANQNVVPDIRMSDSAMAAYEQQIAGTHYTPVTCLPCGFMPRC